MGVHGITSLLKNNGWLPTSTTDCRCSTALFRETSGSSSDDEEESNGGIAQQLLFNSNNSTALPASSLASERVIPPNSKFWIDGNGLSFYLEAVAYARHVNSMLRKNNSTKCITTRAIKKLSHAQISRLLPPLLPMDFVQQVVDEYIDTLLRHQITVHIVWDGPLCRPQKTDTLDKRKSNIDGEWYTFQQFCEYGSVPSEAGCLCSCWKYAYPRAKLASSQIHHALSRCSRKSNGQVKIEVSEEEADLYLAQMATNDPTAYVVGQDSDFFFFANTQYIPMDTLGLHKTSSRATSSSSTTTTVTACVFERSILAKQVLGFSNENRMIDLVYLSGNDYLASTIFRKKYVFNGSPIQFLQEQDDDFHVELPEITADNAETMLDTARTMEFIRAWYDLLDLEEYTLESAAEIVPDVPEPDISKEDAAPQQLVTRMPDDFPMDLTVASGTDRSLKEPILRALQAYLEEQEETADGIPLLDTYQVQAYQDIMILNNTGISSDNSKVRGPDMPNHRPQWRDVQACCIIESCVSRTHRLRKNAILAHGVSPSDLFDPVAFHAYMARKRNETDEVEEEVVDETPPPPETVERVRLPIDEHEELILDHIKNHQVTIIHGETGCGKSSRIPVMLLNAPPPDPEVPRVKFFISQPRRIAAKSLVERVRSVEPEFRDCFALRMGHGWREYETRQTQAWFVTTGYLTRLMANHPEKFDDCSHLIIDEVHERSVDTDILCLLCRRLLERNPRIRLILMSATLAASMYQDYFDLSYPCIHVGVKRFPIKEHFAEDLAKAFRLPKAEAAAANSIVRECEQKQCSSAPDQNGMKNRFKLAARLATVVGNPGASVLIFVPGMGEIVAITEEIENLFVVGTRFTCFPIHSDIPFEDQMLAFDKPKPDEVKIIIATNAAESSVTLPDVDHVICLGLCRQITYNPSSHRQMLVPCWISKASATQRAGRTGRVRPGNVYRLYSRPAYERYMAEFEPGEMVRIPLDSVILMLKEMLHEEIKPVLLSCIEPPNIETIDRSFASLHKWGFIAEPDDSGDITSLGTFVSSIGIDLTLGSVIGLGIQFGLAAEAIDMAAAMSFTKPPFKMTSALFHGPDEYNKFTKEAYISRCHFDANLYSEPLGLMNLMWDYDMASNKMAWCRHFSVVPTRVSQLMSTRKNLRKRAADFFGINEDKLCISAPPVQMPHSKITLLRVFQVWIFSETMIERSPLTPKMEGESAAISLKGAIVEECHVEKFVDPRRHPFQLRTSADIDQYGTFDPDFEETNDIDGFLELFEERVMSYAMESNLKVVVVHTKTTLIVYTTDAVVKGYAEEKFADHFIQDTIAMDRHGEGKKLKGMMERKSGRWFVCEPGAGTGKVERFIYRSDNPDMIAKDQHQLSSYLESNQPESWQKWTFLATGKAKKTNKKYPYRVFGRGNCSEITRTDMRDLLLTGDFVLNKGKSMSKQSIVFKKRTPAPLSYDKADKHKQATIYDGDQTSWSRPLFSDVPEGAKLISVIASGSRKGRPLHRITFTDDKETKDKGNGNNKYDNDDDSVEPIVITPDQNTTDLRKKWSILSTSKQVYVPEHTVPGSTFHPTQDFFCCCSNALEVNGGGLRVEGMTLLPPVRLYLLLAMATFGVESHAFGFKGFLDNSAETSDDSLLRWLKERKNYCGDDVDEDDDYALDRIDMAKEFHKSCMSMGEELRCFPDKVLELCAVFDMVDGYNVDPWEGMNEAAFTTSNLAKWRHEKKCKAAEAEPEENGKNEVKSRVPIRSKDEQMKNKKGEVAKVGKAKAEAMPSIPSHMIPAKARMFSVDLPPGETIGPGELVSTNILALATKVYNDLIHQNDGSHTESINGNDLVGLDSGSWNFLKFTDENGFERYHAKFTNKIVPMRPLKGRGKNKVPRWIKKHERPIQSADAIDAVPPVIQAIQPVQIPVGKQQQRTELAFDDIETAVRMEAAFWLDRYFCSATSVVVRHWYDYTFPQMVEILKEASLEHSARQ